jgi:hypothetical protein
MVTLGAPPTLGGNMFTNTNVAKSVTVKVPNTSAYGTGPELAVSGSSDSPECWANGFRGMGWDGSNFHDDGTGTLNSFITVEIMPL